MKKRDFLTLAGASTLTVLVAGGVWRADSQGVWSAGTGPAYEPWQTWRTDKLKGPLALVQSAILAATPHNTQPWLFQIQNTQIRLYADRSRRLGAMDPYLREMWIGLGCALENMLLAAKAEGYLAQLTLELGTLTRLDANSNPQLVATLNLSPDRRFNSALYNAIPNRHTNRAAYDMQRSVEPEKLAALAAIAEKKRDLKLVLLTSDSDRQLMAERTQQATEAIVADSVMIHDSDRWFRSSWQELQRQRSGVHIDASGLPWIMRSLVKMLPSLSAQTNHQSWLNSTKTALASSPVFGLIAVQDLYDQPQALQAGQLWQQVHLWATSQNLAMQPLNQMPEMVDRERQLGKVPQTAQRLAELIGSSSWKPTFAFRLGYPTSASLASARRSVEEVVRSNLSPSS